MVAFALATDTEEAARTEDTEASEADDATAADEAEAMSEASLDAHAALKQMGWPVIMLLQSRPLLKAYKRETSIPA